MVQVPPVTGTTLVPNHHKGHDYSIAELVTSGLHQVQPRKVLSFLSIMANPQINTQLIAADGLNFVPVAVQAASGADGAADIIMVQALPVTGTTLVRNHRKWP